jgi:hypothetical protein
MTSRRRSQTVPQNARLAFLAFVTVMLAACATLPDDAPVVEQLDKETGTTIARLGRPIELFRETFTQDATSRIAFIGPFESNQMGKREPFLWVAVPIDPAPDSVPIVEVNGTALSLAAPGRTPDFADLSKSPYKLSTPWSATYYFKLDADLIARLGEANDLAIRVLEAGKNGPVKTLFATKVQGDPRLKDFASR